MDDFFKLIYDEAVETGALDHENNRQYRAADFYFRDLLEALPDQAAGETLSMAVAHLLYCSDILCLAYGFRLAAQVIHPVGPVYPTRA